MKNSTNDAVTLEPIREECSRVHSFIIPLMNREQTFRTIGTHANFASSLPSSTCPQQNNHGITCLFKLLFLTTMNLHVPEAGNQVEKGKLIEKGKNPKHSKFQKTERHNESLFYTAACTNVTDE